MTTPEPGVEVESTVEAVSRSSDDLIMLGGLATRLARIRRAPRMPDGAQESDVEHSYFLGLAACEIAGQHFPELDTGLIAEFANVHDLPEIITDDVWSFYFTQEQRAQKAIVDKEAADEMIRTLPPHTGNMLLRYSEQLEPEAKFVRFVDKILPAVLNLINGESSTFLEDYNITSREQLRTEHERIARDLQALFPEYNFIYQLRVSITELVEQRYFPE